MAKNKLTIKVNADTQEALQQMKELTEAANECVEAFEKLEKKMNRFQKEPVTYREWYLNNIGEVQPLGGSITTGIGGTGYSK